MNQLPGLPELLKRWERRVEMTAEDRDAIRQLPFTHKSYPREAYIVREGEPPTTCNLLLSGFAYRQKLVSSGSRQIISIHIEGEFVDIQNALLPVADHNVQSLGRCEVASVPKNALEDLIFNRPNVGRAVWLDTLIDASIFREWVVNVGRRNAPTRIAHLLCELMLRMKRAGLCIDTECEFPFTQEQIADCTGLTAVHTNRTLQSLRRLGLIRLGEGRLAVRDWAGLAEMGDFGELYLHHGV